MSKRTSNGTSNIAGKIIHFNDPAAITDYPHDDIPPDTFAGLYSQFDPNNYDFESNFYDPTDDAILINMEEPEVPEPTIEEEEEIKRMKDFEVSLDMEGGPDIKFTFDDPLDKEFEKSGVHQGNYRGTPPPQSVVPDVVDAYDGTEGSLDNLDKYLHENFDEIYKGMSKPFDTFNKALSSIDVYVKDVFSYTDEIFFLIAHLVAIFASFQVGEVFTALGEYCNQVKIMLTFHAVYFHLNDDGSKDYRKYIFDRICTADKGENALIRTPEAAFKTVFNNAINLINENLNASNVTRDVAFQSKTQFNCIKKVNITIYAAKNYVPPTGNGFIELPRILQHRRAIVNPKVDTNCFIFSVMCSLLKLSNALPVSHQNEPTRIYNAFKELNYTIDFTEFEGDVPCSDSAFAYFMKVNPDYILRVWTPTGLEVPPIKCIFSPQNPPLVEKIIDLLFLPSEDLEVPGHYCAITNIGTLLKTNGARDKRVQCPNCGMINYYRKKNPICSGCKSKLVNRVPDEVIDNQEVFFCTKCATTFTDKRDYIYHMDKCAIQDYNNRPLLLPAERTYLQLSTSDFMKIDKIATFMVADFESILAPLDKQDKKTTFVSRHLPCSYAIKVCSEYKQLETFFVYTGEDPLDTMQHFCDTIIHISTVVYETYCTASHPINPPTAEQLAHHNQAVKCYICGRPFISNSQARKKVRDHDHITGEYLGAACASCNIQRVLKNQFIPLFFHNGKNYDLHHIIKEITKEKYGCVFAGIPENSEKIMSLTIKRYKGIDDDEGTNERSMCDIRILDSLAFLLSGLEKLTEVFKLKHPDNHKLSFPITFSTLGGQPYNYTDEQIELALLKNAYPYLWFTDFEKFYKPLGELTALFDGNKYEWFTEKADDEYKEKFAKKRDIYYQVIKSFKFETVRDYAELYVSMDVLQLTDILVFIRNVYKEVHKLDMFQFYGLPGYTWAAFQYHIKDIEWKPELFCDGEMNKICFFLQAVRGGCSGIMLRYSKANNELIHDYDRGRDRTYLLYFDANNLYGWSMSQDLPYANFEWVSQLSIAEMNESLEKRDLFIKELKTEFGNGKGCYVECDLIYPRRIHDQHQYYPLAPVRRSVAEEEISAYSKYINEISGCKHNKSSRMLLQTLEPRRHYFCYYKNLLFYVNHGMMLGKVYNIITFKERPLMRSYIEMNTQMRNQATSVAEKNMWKNMNNSVFGKTLENQINYSDLVFVNNEKDFTKTVMNPGFRGHIFVQDNFMIARVLYQQLTLNKPCYLGATITELAKLHMFEFYYDVLQPFFGWENVKLCMTDTDSLLLEITLPEDPLKPDYNIYSAISDIQKRFDCPIDTSGIDPEIIAKYKIKGDHNKEVGYFKSETGSKPIREFVGLRSKVYSYIMEENPEEHHTRAKGVGRDALKLIEHESYKKCIFNQDDPELIRQNVDVPLIRSKTHKLYSMIVSKIGLSCNDTKRYICSDNIHTLPYGHYRIPEEEDKTLEILEENDENNNNNNILTS